MLKWNRALLRTTLTSGADVSMLAFEQQEDILNKLIHHDKISQNIINCNKLS